MSNKGTTRRTINRLVKKLEKKGLTEAARRLEEVVFRLDSALVGATWLERSSRRVAAVFSRHVENAGEEVQQTAQLVDVARRLLVRREQVSRKDREAARSQLLDLLKTVPASAVLAGTFLIPVPGAQPILGPLLMEKLGLLPSAWTESNLEKELRDLLGVARRYLLDDVEDELEKLLEETRGHVRRIKDLDRFVRANPDWMVFFDENLDKKISSAELEILGQRVERLAARAARNPGAQEWYAFFHGKDGSDVVRGPLSFVELEQQFGRRRNVLARSSEEEWWVPLWALLEEIATEEQG